jgi:hypothetical protein
MTTPASTGTRRNEFSSIEYLMAGGVPLPPYVEASEAAKVRKLAMKLLIGEKRMSPCNGPSVSLKSQ